MENISFEIKGVLRKPLTVPNMTLKVTSKF
jgi:hypothetical protein